MTQQNFKKILKKELLRIDQAGTTKRKETIIEKFVNLKGMAPKAIIKGKKYSIFNSNDYLGLRFHPKVIEAEENAARIFGAGPGAVRFISGTLKVHKDLEQALATFHQREDAIIFSSTFVLNFGVLHALIKGQSRDSLIGSDTLVISDQLNHRSIIDGIRIANLPKKQKIVFKHIDMKDLNEVLEKNKQLFQRAIIVTDGVFSMLGEYQNLAKIKKIVTQNDHHFIEGIITVVDDAHGVAAFGETGRGTEEVCKTKCDLLIGTLGKGFGADGGYIVGEKVYMDYLRESTSTYIYSNPISPGTTGAALQAVKIVDSAEGRSLIKKLQENIDYFKESMKKKNFSFAVNSSHPVQALLIGDTNKTKKLARSLFEKRILVTPLAHPVVEKGKDEIRIQLSALHSKNDIDTFVNTITQI
jgi:glycine C-acetyltransferase